MSQTINVHVEYDPDARVWFVEHSDVHGLRLESPTVEELVERIPGAIQDLLEDGNETHDIPIEVIAHRSVSVRLHA
ncbi:MAG: DUF1902 domain-containing protein [Ignavibacteriales bacterium]